MLTPSVVAGMGRSRLRRRVIEVRGAGHHIRVHDLDIVIDGIDERTDPDHHRVHLTIEAVEASWRGWAAPGDVIVAGASRVVVRSADHRDAPDSWTAAADRVVLIVQCPT